MEERAQRSSCSALGDRPSSDGRISLTVGSWWSRGASLSFRRYRRFVRPDDRGWNTGNWVRWLREQQVAPSVLADDVGTCSLCRAPTPVGPQGTPYDRCYNCQRTFSSVLDGFVPMCYSLEDGLEGILRYAKDRPSYSWLKRPLAALLCNFTTRHIECIESFYGGSFDLRITMPSHRSTRGGVSHLDSLIAQVRDFDAEWTKGLLVKNDPSKAGSRREQIVHGLFTASPMVRGKRVLLFDDTYTTGGSMASAASALKRSGASSVVGLSFGRQLNAGWRDSREFVASLAGRGLDIGKCVVHGDRKADPFKSFSRQPG